MQARKQLAGGPAASLSNADLIALAGAAAVRVCGGPVMRIPVGRVDASEADPENRMPAETEGVEALKACFARQGLSTREMVVLSGAHTVRMRLCFIKKVGLRPGAMFRLVIDLSLT